MRRAADGAAAKRNMINPAKRARYFSLCCTRLYFTRLCSFAPSLRPNVKINDQKITALKAIERDFVRKLLPNTNIAVVIIAQSTLPRIT